jgi:hypothetical protein
MSVHIPNMSVHILNMSVHIPNMSVHIPNMSVHIPNMSVHIPNMSVHIPNMSVHILNMSVHISSLYYLTRVIEITNITSAQFYSGCARQGKGKGKKLGWRTIFVANDLDAKIEKWKNKLLDFSKRNRLLNYHETKRSSLKIFSPGCFSLYESFVLNEILLEYPTVEEHDGNEEDFIIEKDYPIKTNQSPRETQRTLKTLRDKAKTALEEQGINILYLSFGFLKWTETESEDSNWFNSPILLVPVSLINKSINLPYILSLREEDEIVVNPTLAYKLQNDFGITLPRYTEDDGLDSLFSEITQLVKPNGWKVVSEVSLSLLSFLKISMYNDLIKRKEAIIANPIVRTISKEATAPNKIFDDIVNYDYDKNLTPTDMFQVVDADASQQDAILCAKKGISFVLQGPPGTGKSQTITNIIAECLAEGKKVLFVSEKMAALEVVHRRLTNANLNDFCLILHSNKANKRAVLDQLGATLDLAQNKKALSDEAFQKLDLLQADKEKLNEYAKQVFDTVMPLDKSIYQVNGVLAHLESYDYVIFLIDNIGKVDAKQFNRFIHLLQQFATTIGKMTDDYKSNPWYGATVPSVSHELRHDLGQKLGVLISKVEDAQKRVIAQFDTLSLDWQTSYQAIIDIIPVIKTAKNVPVIPAGWILGNTIEPLFEEITECETLKALFWQKHSELKGQYAVISANDSTVNLPSSNGLMNAVAIESALSAVNSVLNASFPYFCMNADFSSAQALFIAAQDKAKQLNELTAQISSVFEDTVFSIDYNGILARYKTEYRSIFKIFKKSYRNDRKQILLQYRNIAKKITDEQVLALISQLRQVSELRGWFEYNQVNIKRFFGELIVNEQSDFEISPQNYKNQKKRLWHIIHFYIKDLIPTGKLSVVL